MSSAVYTSTTEVLSGKMNLTELKLCCGEFTKLTQF